MSSLSVRRPTDVFPLCDVDKIMFVGKSRSYKISVRIHDRKMEILCIEILFCFAKERPEEYRIMLFAEKGFKVPYFIPVRVKGENVVYAFRSWGIPAGECL